SEPRTGESITGARHHLPASGRLSPRRSPLACGSSAQPRNYSTSATPASRFPHRWAPLAAGHRKPVRQAGAACSACWLARRAGVAHPQPAPAAAAGVWKNHTKATALAGHLFSGTAPSGQRHSIDDFNSRRNRLPFRATIQNHEPNEITSPAISLDDFVLDDV